MSNGPGDAAICAEIRIFFDYFSGNAIFVFRRLIGIAARGNAAISFDLFGQSKYVIINSLRADFSFPWMILFESGRGGVYFRD